MNNNWLNWVSKYLTAVLKTVLSHIGYNSDETNKIYVKQIGDEGFHQTLLDFKKKTVQEKGVCVCIYVSRSAS